MNIITDYKTWVDAVEIDTNAELYALYRSVKDCAPNPPFEVAQANGRQDRWIISVPHISDGLLLTEKSREAFLTHIKAGVNGHSIESEE